MKNKQINVGQHGFVRLVDYMGSDQAIVQAARVSYGPGTKTYREDYALIRYLMRNKHMSPFEMVEFKFHVKVPIDIWRQWIRHRTASVNEVSTRYSTPIEEHNATPPEAWRLQSKNNKQGSSDEHLYTSNKEMAELLSQEEDSLIKHSEEVYDLAIRLGVAREQARKNILLSRYTEAYWKMDLRNLLHFLKLRLDSHAQQEIREYAQAILELIRDVVPITIEAFEDYELNSVIFTADELKHIKSSLAIYYDTLMEGGLIDCLNFKTKADKRVFLSKLRQIVDKEHY